jgi:DNA-binding HxlR family transcriptional regulator
MVAGDARYLERWRDLRHLLNGEWIIYTLVALSTGPLHYKDLHAAVQDSITFDPWSGSVRKIGGRALGRTLRRLEAGGMIHRHEERVFPRSVIYSLTPAANDLLIRAQPIVDWADRHPELFTQLRSAQVESNGHHAPSGGEPPDDDVLD